ncbi:MAG: hypothetical protein QXF79_03145, partial [Ignisphaera sp.]
MRVVIDPSKVQGSIEAPQSKSYAIRYIFSSTLVPIELNNIVLSRDVEAAIDGVKALNIEYSGGVFRKKREDLRIVKEYVNFKGSATTLRMFIPIASVVGGRITVDGDETLRRRPIKTLIEALDGKGVKFSSINLPTTIEGKLRDTYVEISGAESSQYVSGFMIAFAVAGGGTIKIKPPIVSRSYIYLTAYVLKQIGVDVSITGNRIDIDVRGNLVGYKGEIPGDYLLASFYVASALLTGGNIEIKGLPPPVSDIGDHVVVEIYRNAGAYSEYSGGVWYAKASDFYKGIEVDVEDSPDLAISIIPIAAIANGLTVIRGATRLRIKESDRISSVVEVLKRFGITVETDGENIWIKGGEPRETEIECPNDHRIAMMATSIALRR